MNTDEIEDELDIVSSTSDENDQDDDSQEESYEPPTKRPARPKTVTLEVSTKDLNRSVTPTADRCLMSYRRQLLV